MGLYIKYHADSCSRSSTHGAKLSPGGQQFVHYAMRLSLPADYLFVSEFIDFMKHLKIFQPHKD